MSDLTGRRTGEKVFLGDLTGRRTGEKVFLGDLTGRRTDEKVFLGDLTCRRTDEKVFLSDLTGGRTGESMQLWKSFKSDIDLTVHSSSLFEHPQMPGFNHLHALCHTRALLRVTGVANRP